MCQKQECVKPSKNVMSLLAQAQKEKAAERAAARRKEKQDEIAAKRLSESYAREHTDWHKRLKALVEERDIKLEENPNCLGILKKKNETLGYFFHVAYSTNDYASDYGCTVYNHYDYILFTRHHYYSRDDRGYFKVDCEQSKGKTIEKIGKEMVDFYKSQL